MSRYKEILIALIFLCSVGLFYIRGLGINMRVIEVFGLVLIFSHLIFYSIFSRITTERASRFSLPIIFLLAGVFFSTFTSLRFHGQSIGETLYFQRHIYAILFYFLLFYLKPKPQFLINLFLYLAVANSILYIIQYFLYPTIITDAKVLFQRGTVRINLPGTDIRHLAFFLCIDRIFRYHNWKYVIFALLIFAVAILSGYRSSLALYLIITAGYLFFVRRLKNRLLLISIFSITVFAGLIVFQSIVLEMKESVVRDRSAGSEYIRFKTSKFLLIHRNPNLATYVFGNGQPGEKSKYGREGVVIANRYGYYISDTGIIGFYYRFGVISLFAVLYILIFFIRQKLTEELRFIKLYILFQVLLMFNTVIIFDSLSGVVLISALMYMIEYQFNNETTINKRLTLE